MGIFSNVSPQEKAINTQIQLTHSQINELYTDLGRYVKLNLKDQINDQYVQNASKNIDDCLARLQQLNKDLIGARGNKLCVNCSAEIPMAVSFCPSCGTQQPPVMGMAGAMPMNNGMNAGMPMNNANAQPNFNQRPTFTPGGAGNSPSNPNRNMAPGANNAQPAPAAPAQPMPPINDIPVVPPVPAAPTAPEVTQAPEAAPVPEVTQAPTAEPITETTVTNEAPAAVINEAPAAAAAESFIFCSQCGHKEASGVAFCSQCGSKL